MNNIFTYNDKETEFPSLSEVIDQIHKDFEEKNRKTYDFLKKYEEPEFIEKLLDFANEVAELSDLREHEQNIIEDKDFIWRKNEDYPYSDEILCAFNQTVNGGYTGDSFSGYAFVKLPKSGKVFQFEYSM